MTKRILTIVFSAIFIGAFAFCLTWGIINFNKVKDGMSGTGIYTEVDLNNAYEDGYNKALENEQEYIELIAGYRDTITTLNDNISQLNSQVNKLTNSNKDYSIQVDKLYEQKESLETQVDNLNEIRVNNEKTISSLNTQITSLQNQVNTLTSSGENKSEQIAQLNIQVASLQNLVTQLQTTNNMNVDTITGLNVQISNLNNQISEMTLLAQNSTSQIANLNNKIIELQKSVTYYESYIAQLESGEQVVATFEYDGSVYNIQIANKGSTLAVTNPTSTEYKIFNGWKVNDEIINLSTYTISQNTKFVADVTYKYDVIFKVDSEVYNSQIVVKNETLTLPTNPTKNGYEFDGWSKNGVNVIDNIQSILVTENTIYEAVFTKLYNAIFVYEDVTKSTQSIRNGNYATAPTIENTDYKVFNCWKVNGNSVDLNTYKIFADTIFVADITYSYNVDFYANDGFYDWQIIAEGNYAILPINPTKTGYEFDGWTINGIDIIDISTISITYDIAFVAKFTKLNNVTFIVNDEVSEVQQVRNGNKIVTNETLECYVWLLNDEIVNLAEYIVTADITFVGKPKLSALESITFEFNNGYMSWFQSTNVWNYNGNTYYSSGNSQFIFDKSSMTWNAISFYGDLSSYVSGGKILIYHNKCYLFDNNGRWYILNDISNTWTETNDITMNGIPSLDIDNRVIWVCDGETLYYSYNSNQLRFDDITKTWVKMNWNGFSSIGNGYSGVWTYKGEYYYDTSSAIYKLDKKTNTWNIFETNNSSCLYLGYSGFWSDGVYLYCSYNKCQYVLDEKTNTWIEKTWTGLSSSMYATSVWTDGTNYYYSGGSSHYKFI